MAKTVAQLSPLSTPTNDDFLLVWDNNSLNSYKTTVSQLFTNIPNGTVGSPSFTFVNDNTTGVYSIGSGQLGISISGSNKVTVNSIGIGINKTPSYPLDIGSTSAIRLPVGNTTDRNAITPVTGLIRYNTTSGTFEGRDASSWRSFVESGDSASVLNFTQSGTGAVSRTVDSKLKDWVSVKDFGAVGDGVTDDTSAFQAALTEIQTSGGGKLVIPRSTSAYAIKQANVISVDFTGIPLAIVGNGAVLDCTSIASTTSGNVIQITGGAGTDIRLRDLKIKGRIDDASGSLNGVRITGCDYLAVDSLSMDGFGGTNFLVAPVTGDTPAVNISGSIRNSRFTRGAYSNCTVNANNMVIDGNYFADAGRAGIGVSQGYGLVIAGYYNTVSNNTSNGSYRYGIDVRNTSNVVVTNNSIYGNRVAGIYGVNENTVKKFRNARITGNLINNAGNPNTYGMWVGQYGTSSDTPTNSLVIANNIIRGCANYYGILVACDWYSSSYALDRLLIQGNLLDNNPSVIQGIRIDNSATGEVQDAIISGNVLSNSSYIAALNCQNLTIANNIVRVTANTTLNYGILVSRQWGAGRTARVTSNILDTAGTFTNPITVTQFTDYYQDSNYLNGAEVARSYSTAPSIIANSVTTRSLTVSPSSKTGKNTFSISTSGSAGSLGLATIQLPSNENSVYAVVNLYSSRYSNNGKADYIIRISARNVSGTIEVKAVTIAATNYEAGITQPSLSITSSGTTLTLTITQNGTYTQSFGEVFINVYGGTFAFI